MLFHAAIYNATPELGMRVYLDWMIDVSDVFEGHFGYLSPFHRLQSHYQSTSVVSDLNSQHKRGGSHTMRRGGRARP